MTKRQALAELNTLLSWIGYVGNPETNAALQIAITALESQIPKWETAPEWAEWFAIDENGAAFFYGTKPELQEDCFKMNLHCIQAKGLFPDWQDSLESRRSP